LLPRAGGGLSRFTPMFRNNTEAPAFAGAPMWRYANAACAAANRAIGTR